VTEVSETKILVFPTKDGRQVTVYQNSVGVRGGEDGDEQDEKEIKALKDKQEKEFGNAMVLPCPLKAGQKVQLLDLSKDGFSFDRVEEFFPKRPPGSSSDEDLNDDEEGEKGNGRSFLAVAEVGSYFISIAENLADLRRIDPKVFKVSTSLEAVMKGHYAQGFAFIICSFNPKKKIEGGHPVAFVHDLMPDGHLFVPCRHEHGHGTQAKENFDHWIYSINTAHGDAGDTREEMAQKHPGWEYAKKQTPLMALSSTVMKPLYPEIKTLRRRRMMGPYSNEDLFFTRA